MVRFHCRAALIALVIILIAVGWSGQAAAQVRFAVTLPAGSVEQPVTGRLIVVADRRADGAASSREPRQMIGMNGPPAFGVDVENLRPGATVIVDAKADGFPFDLDQLPVGDYRVQAVLIR